MLLYENSVDNIKWLCVFSFSLQSWTVIIQYKSQSFVWGKQKSSFSFSNWFICLCFVAHSHCLLIKYHLTVDTSYAQFHCWHFSISVSHMGILHFLHCDWLAKEKAADLSWRFYLFICFGLLNIFHFWKCSTLLKKLPAAVPFKEHLASSSFWLLRQTRSTRWKKKF